MVDAFLIIIIIVIVTIIIVIIIYQFERAINSECHLHLAEVDCCRRVSELRFRFRFRKVGLAERR